MMVTLETIKKFNLAHTLCGFVVQAQGKERRDISKVVDFVSGISSWNDAVSYEIFLMRVRRCAIRRFGKNPTKLQKAVLEALQ